MQENPDYMFVISRHKGRCWDPARQSLQESGLIVPGMIHQGNDASRLPFVARLCGATYVSERLQATTDFSKRTCSWSAIGFSRGLEFQKEFLVSQVVFLIKANSPWPRRALQNPALAAWTQCRSPQAHASNGLPGTLFTYSLVGNYP